MLNINKRINLDPKIWGPYGWLFIESCIISYSNNPNEKDRENFKNFLENIKNILPCSKCRDHFSDYIKNNPLNNNILSTKENLLKWLLGAKNIIRKKNNKREISYEELIKYYINFYSINDINEESCSSTCTKKCLKKKSIISEEIKEYIYIIIFIMLIYILLKYYKKIQ